MKSIDRTGINSISKVGGTQSVMSKVIPITPEVIEAGLDVVGKVVDLFKDVVNLLVEIQHTKQIRIEAKSRIDQDIIKYKTDLLHFTTRMGELKNQHDLIQQRGEIITETNQRCNALLEEIIALTNIKISDDPEVEKSLNIKISLLIRGLNSAQDSLTKM